VGDRSSLGAPLDGASSATRFASAVVVAAVAFASTVLMFSSTLDGVAVGILIGRVGL
jgi:hypothetical protein